MTAIQKNIYRKDFVVSQKSKSEGEILIPASLSMSIWAFASIAIVVAIAAFLYFGEYTRKAYLEGIVMPSSGLIKIIARSALSLARQHAKILQSVMDKFNELFIKKYISQIDYDRKKENLLVQLEKIELHQQTLIRLKRDISNAESQRDMLTQQREIRSAEYGRQLNIIKQQKFELAVQQETVLTAPTKGKIGVVLGREGQTVKQNDPLLMLVPDNSYLQVELYAPSKSVGFIKPNQRVGLRFTSFPFEKFGIQYGLIKKITAMSINPLEMTLQTPSVWREKEGLYRIIVNLDKTTITAYGCDEPIRVGMTVSAVVELDNRRLYEWLLKPIFHLRG